MKPFQKASLFAAFSLAAFLWMAAENFEEIKYELIIFFVYVMVMTIAQAAMIALAGSFEKKIPKAQHLSTALAAAFTGVTIFTMILLNTETLAGVGRLAAAGIVLCLAALFSVLYGLKKPGAFKIAGRFTMVLAVVFGSQLAFNAMWRDPFRFLPEHFTIPEFTRRPNVYVITFDSMSPKSTYQNIMGLQGSGFEEKVAKFNGKIIPNTFAERISTKWSLNSFLSMDMDYFNSFKKKNLFLTDQAATPVYEIFRKNGYKIQFMYDTYYFGDDHGRLDYYGAAKIQGLCAHIEKPYAFLGYCFPQVQAAVQDFTDIRNEDFVDYFINRVTETARSDTPWYTQTHIYMPGHTGTSFDPWKKEDWDEFRGIFKDKTATAVTLMDKIFTSLKKNDPNAIIITFGDHGPITARSLIAAESDNHNALDFSEKDVPKGSPLNFKQVVQDRHAVFFAVFPKEFCQDGFKHNPYSTVRIMRDVVKCLSGGQDPLPADFQPNDDQWKPYSYSN